MIIRLLAIFAAALLGLSVASPIPQESKIETEQQPLTVAELLQGVSLLLSIYLSHLNSQPQDAAKAREAAQISAALAKPAADAPTLEKTPEAAVPASAAPSAPIVEPQSKPPAELSQAPVPDSNNHSGADVLESTMAEGGGSTTSDVSMTNQSKHEGSATATLIEGTAKSLAVLAGGTGSLAYALSMAGSTAASGPVLEGAAGAAGAIHFTGSTLPPYGSALTSTDSGLSSSNVTPNSQSVDNLGDGGTSGGGQTPGSANADAPNVVGKSGNSESIERFSENWHALAEQEQRNVLKAVQRYRLSPALYMGY